MSGIYIPDMEMPKRDATFLVHVNGDQIDTLPPRKYCDEYQRERKTYKLIPVPPHGRLIDADELYSVLRKRAKEFSDSEYGDGVKCGLADAREYIKIAPTIIPADTEEDGDREE